MLSISEVARRDVIGRIERLGVRNVVIDSVKPERIRKREKRDSSESKSPTAPAARRLPRPFRESLDRRETIP